MNIPRNRKTVLITGATSGIGKELVKLYLKGGDFVILVGRDLKQLKSEVLVNYPENQWIFIPCNLKSKNEIETLISTIKSSFLEVDALIHSAGIIELGEMKDAPVEWLDDLLSVNVSAPYQLTRGLVELLVKVKGSVVFVNSTAGVDSWKGISQYAASKHALRAIALSIREELEPIGVKVVNVYPGATDSPMQRKIQKIEGNPYDPEEFMNSTEVARAVYDNLKYSSAYVPELVIKPWKNR